MRTCNKLISLTKQYPTNRQIQLDCAKAIYNSIESIEIDSNYKQLLLSLRDLSEQVEVEEISVLFANSLEDYPEINNSKIYLQISIIVIKNYAYSTHLCKRYLMDIISYFNSDPDLEIILNEYLDNPSDEFLSEQYVGILFEAVLNNDIEQKTVIQEFAQIHSVFPNNEEIAEALSYAMIPWEEHNETLFQQTKVLGNLFSSFSNNEAIAEDYVAALSLAAKEQTIEELTASLETVDAIIDCFPNDQEIPYYRDIIKDFLDNRMVYSEASHTIDTLSEPANESDAINWASELSKLANVAEDLDNCQTAVIRLEALVKKYPASEELLKYYTDSLCALANHQKPRDAASTINIIHNHYRDNPTEIFAEIYATAIEAITAIQEEHVKELSNLFSAFPSNYQIASSYACGLYGLSDSIDVENPQRKQLIKELENLSKELPNNDDVAEYLQNAIDAFEIDLELAEFDNSSD